MAKKIETEFIPNYRHKIEGLLVELNRETGKYRFKGLADMKCSNWYTLRATPEGIEYITVMGERMYISPGWDFRLCKPDGEFLIKRD